MTATPGATDMNSLPPVLRWKVTDISLEQLDGRREGRALAGDPAAIAVRGMAAQDDMIMKSKHGTSELSGGFDDLRTHPKSSTLDMAEFWLSFANRLGGLRL